MPTSQKPMRTRARGGLWALTAAVTGGLFVLAAAVPTASAQSERSMCSGDGNRFFRFVGGSYVSKNKFCDVEQQLAAQEDAAKQAEIRAGAMRSERDLGLARVAELEAQLTAAGTCREDELQAALQAARSQNIELLDGQDSLTSQIAGLDLQIDQLRSTIDGQQVQLDSAMSGEEGMSAEIVRLTAALKASETEALAVRTERDSVQAGYEALGGQSRADKTRLATELENTVGLLTACRADFEAHKANVAQATSASGDLQGQLALAQANATDFETKLKAMQAENTTLRAELATRSTELETSAALANQLPDTAAALATSEKTVEGLKLELEQRQDAAKTAQNVLNGQLADAQATLAERDALIADLQARVAQSQAARDADVASLQNRLSDLSEAASKVPMLTGDVKSRDNRIARLEADLAAVQSSSGDASNRMAGLQALIGKRGSDLDRVQTSLTAALASKAALEGQFDESSKNLNATEALLAKAEGELKLLKTHIASLDASYETERAAATNRIRVLEAPLAAMSSNSAESGELSAQLAAAQSEIETLRAALRNAGHNQSSGTLNSALRQWMERSRASNDDGLFLNGDRLVLSSGASLFQPGSARLSENGQVLLQGMAADLQEAISTLPEDEAWQLEVLGHADATPSGSRWPSNWELSSFRAATVVRTLVDAGLPPERLAAVGMGEFQPLIDEATPEAYAQNRRIELQFR